MAHKLLIGYYLKKKNRRIEVCCYRNNDDGNDFAFTIKTKRLIDFKTREIMKLDLVFGLDSIMAIRDALMLITDEAIFKKLANVALNRVAKDKFKMAKYIDEEYRFNSEDDFLRVLK